MPEDVDGWPWEVIPWSEAVRGDVVVAERGAKEADQKGGQRRNNNESEALPVAERVETLRHDVSVPSHGV